MNPLLRNVLAVISGIIAGSAVNMGIIMISGAVIAPPDGADVTTMEGLKNSMHLFGPEHFVFPFLAHALGTFAGAAVAAALAATRKLRFALAIGVFFLAGGIANIVMLPSPWWFTLLDVTCAYIPMAYLGGRLMTKRSAALVN